MSITLLPITLKYGIPAFVSGQFRSVSAEELDKIRFQNQFVIGNSTPRFPASPDLEGNFIVFLEYVNTDATWDLQDRDGNNFITGLPTTVDWTHNPLRIDGGFRINITGTIIAARGFYKKV